MSYQGRNRATAALILFGILVTGCAWGEKPERTREASRLAEQYLAAVAGGSEDRGWSLLHPDARRDMFSGNMERYVNLALASDWSTFEWTVESVVADDPSLFFIRLRTRPPAFLVQPGDGNLRILASNDNGSATLAVRLDALASGVWPSGG